MSLPEDSTLHFSENNLPTFRTIVLPPYYSLKIEAAGSFKTSVIGYQTAQRHIPENRDLQSPT
jgi:hypothetical protein